MQPDKTVTPATKRSLDVDPDEISGAVAARQQLGPDAEEAVIAAFLDRTAHAIDTRVDQRIAAHGSAEIAPRRAAPANRPGSGARATVALGSMLIGFMVTGISLEEIHLYGIIVALFAWAAIVGINVVFGRERPR